MDTLIVREKLESLRRCIRRIEEKRADSVQALLNDADRQDIIVLNLTRSVQLCVDWASLAMAESNEPAPHTMGEALDVLARADIIDDKLSARMRAAVGFRNIAVHGYQVINWDIVHAITHERLADFRAFARAMDRLP